MIDPDLIHRLGTEPIPGGAPTGAPVRYDPLFEQVEAQIARLGSPHGGEVDWKLVAESCCTILASRSKDLVIAAWLAGALAQTEGLPGLERGLSCVRDLIVNFWDGLHPELARLRARRSALQWLCDRLAAVVPAMVATAEDRGRLQASMAVVADLATRCRDRFPGEDPGLDGLTARLRELLSEHPEVDGGTSAVAASGTEPAPSPAGQPGAGRQGGPVSDRPGSRQEALARLRLIAEYFIRSEPHSPIGPLLMRAVGWAGMSFQEVFQDLVRNDDAKHQVWEALGLRPPTSAP